MQYIHVAKDNPQDQREQCIDLAGINIPVPPNPDFRVKQEPQDSASSDAPVSCIKRERIIGLKDEDAVQVLKRPKQ